MPSMRFIEHEDKFLEYSWSVYEAHFNDKASFIDKYNLTTRKQLFYFAAQPFFSETVVNRRKMWKKRIRHNKHGSIAWKNNIRKIMILSMDHEKKKMDTL